MKMRTIWTIEASISCPSFQCVLDKTFRVVRGAPRTKNPVVAYEKSLLTSSTGVLGTRLISSSTPLS